MIKLLFNILLVVGFVYVLKEMFSSGKPTKPAPKPPPKPAPRAEKDAELLIQDPQCGVYVPVTHAVKGTDGRMFCSEECLNAFKAAKG